MYKYVSEILGARATFLAVQSRNAYKGKSSIRKGGLPFGGYQQEQLIATVGMFFIPLYLFFAVLLILFIISVSV